MSNDERRRHGFGRLRQSAAAADRRCNDASPSSAVPPEDPVTLTDGINAALRRFIDPEILSGDR